MRRKFVKGTLMQFVVLFGLWLLLSGKFDLFHMSVGFFSALAVTIVHLKINKYLYYTKEISGEASLSFARLAHPLAVTAIAAAAGFSITNSFYLLGSGPVRYSFGGWPAPVGIEYVIDPLSVFIAAVINVIALIVLVHAGKIVKKEIPDHRHVPYFALVLLFLCGCNGIVLTGDLFNLYVFLEISSLALYGIIAVGDKRSPVAAFRYLIMGTVGGGFYLLGVGFLYVGTGSLNMADVKAILPALGSEPLAVVALSLMVLGLGIKMALFPLHALLPYPVHFNPYTIPHLVETVQILIFTFAAFWVLRKKLEPHADIALDLDWLFRRPASFLKRVFIDGAAAVFTKSLVITDFLIGQTERLADNPPAYLQRSRDTGSFRSSPFT